MAVKVYELTIDSEIDPDKSNANTQELEAASVVYVYSTPETVRNHSDTEARWRISATTRIEYTAGITPATFDGSHPTIEVDPPYHKAQAIALAVHHVPVKWILRFESSAKRAKSKIMIVAYDTATTDQPPGLHPLPLRCDRPDFTPPGPTFPSASR